MVFYDMSTKTVSANVDPSCILLCGHSRGGKLSVLAAGQDTRIKALVLLDPVNNTAMTPSGPEYPSAFPILATITSEPRNMPVLIVGAGANDDFVPAEGNYRRFTQMCYGPAWELELNGVGHLQFLDKQNPLFSLFSAAGSSPDAAVRAVSKVGPGVAEFGCASKMGS
eukprot:gene10021-7910_t